jgi:molybdopterin molybdotransferase
MNNVNHTFIPDALRVLLDICNPVDRKSFVDLKNADNRIVYRDIISPRDSPHYTSGRGDGYAVRAADTTDASKESGVLLTLVTSLKVTAGTCAVMNHGGVLPKGADAFVRLEDTRKDKEGIRILTAVNAGDNLILQGSGFKKGTTVFPEGSLLKPTDIGTLGMLGFTRIGVYDKPRVLIIPTGDEVVERGKEPGAGKVNESNGTMCSLMVNRWGGKPTIHSIVKDNPQAIEKALKEGLDYDLIITTGGTSVGARDRITEVISAVGKVLVHYVAIVPGRPMGIGFVEGNGKKVPVLIMPGPVAACATTMFIFAPPAIRKLAHLPEPNPVKEKAVLIKDAQGFGGFTRLQKLFIENGHATPMNTAGDPIGKGKTAYILIEGESKGYREKDSVEAVFLE